MPKRPLPEDDIQQPIKKHQITTLKSRKIRSPSAERSLQLLYEGAARYDSFADSWKKDSKVICSDCAAPTDSVATCSYCERDMCVECRKTCYKCRGEFCTKCSFCTYDQNETVCYSCCTHQK